MPLFGRKKKKKDEDEDDEASDSGSGSGDDSGGSDSGSDGGGSDGVGGDDGGDEAAAKAGAGAGGDGDGGDADADASRPRTPKLGVATPVSAGARARARQAAKAKEDAERRERAKKGGGALKHVRKAAAIIDDELRELDEDEAAERAAAVDRHTRWLPKVGLAARVNKPLAGEDLRRQQEAEARKAEHLTAAELAQRALPWTRQDIQGKFRGYRFESQFPVPGTQLFEDRERVGRQLTEEKLSTAVKDERERALPLHRARREGTAEYERLQFEHGFGTMIDKLEDVITDREQTALSYAVYRKTDMPDDPKLFHMIRRGDWGGVARMFSEHTLENVNAAEPVNQMTGLMKAASAGQPKVVKLFCEHDADPNQENRTGNVAIHYAWDSWLRVPQESLFKVVKLVHTMMVVQTLCEHNANPNIPLSDTGVTALHYAAAHGHAIIAQTLLRYHGDPHIKDENGFTPLDYAEQNGHKEVAGLLRNWDTVARYMGVAEFRLHWGKWLRAGETLKTDKGTAAQLIDDLRIREHALSLQPLKEIPVVQEAETEAEITAQLLGTHSKLPLRMLARTESSRAMTSKSNRRRTSMSGPLSRAAIGRRVMATREQTPGGASSGGLGGISEDAYAEAIEAAGHAAAATDEFAGVAGEHGRSAAPGMALTTVAELGSGGGGGGGDFSSGGWAPPGSAPSAMVGGRATTPGMRVGALGDTAEGAQIGDTHIEFHDPGVVGGPGGGSGGGGGGGGSGGGGVGDGVVHRANMTENWFFNSDRYAARVRHKKALAVDWNKHVRTYTGVSLHLAKFGKRPPLLGAALFADAKLTKAQRKAAKAKKKDDERLAAEAKEAAEADAKGAASRPSTRGSASTGAGAGAGSRGPPPEPEPLDMYGEPDNTAPSRGYVKGARGTKIYDTAVTRRRLLAARHLADDANGAVLQKEYNTGEQYVRRTAEASAVLRGHRLRVIKAPGGVREVAGGDGAVGSPKMDKKGNQVMPTGVMLPEKKDNRPDWVVTEEALLASTWRPAATRQQANPLKGIIASDADEAVATASAAAKAGAPLFSQKKNRTLAGGMVSTLEKPSAAELGMFAHKSVMPPKVNELKVDPLKRFKQQQKVKAREAKARGVYNPYDVTGASSTSSTLGRAQPRLEEPWTYASWSFQRQLDKQSQQARGLRDDA